MRSSLRILVCLLVLATAGVLALPQAAEARSNVMVIDQYYTDDTFTTQVGWQTVMRCGGTSGPLNGTQTEYVYWQQIECIDWSRPAFGCKYEVRDGYLGPVIVSQPVMCPDHLRH